MRTCPRRTLTGTWAVSGSEAGDVSLSPISFPVRVSPEPIAIYPFPAELLSGFQVGVELKDGARSFLGTGTQPATLEEAEEGQDAYLEACPGNPDEPEAGAGFLCIYEGESEGSLATPPFISPTTPLEAANEFGIVLPFKLSDVHSNRRGSWAVTG